MTEQKESLLVALEARKQEVFHYQLNINNYERALRHITKLNDTDLEEFKQNLTKLLTSERLEQKKAKVMRDVIAEQLQEMEDVRPEAT